MEKAFLVLFALVAGVGGAAAYEFTAKHVAAPLEQKVSDHAPFLQAKIAVIEQQLQDLTAAQDSATPQAEVLAARLDALEGRIAALREEQAARQVAGADDSAASEKTATSGSTSGQPGNNGERRISGEELVAAMKELPEEGVQMVRSAIRKEIERIRKQQEERKNPRVELEKKAEQGIRKLTTALSLTPVQVEQAKEIAARFIDRIVEVDRIAGERDDPTFAENAKKELEVELRAEVVQILSPEQLDRARELDPEGIGRQYPRGF
jgi:hypothetical protein